MKILLLILFSSIIALLVDWYIYRRVIKRHNFGRLWKVGYIVYAILIDTAVVSALIAYRSATDAEAAEMLRGVMWVIALFFLNVGPKLVYTVISFGDYAVQYFRKRNGNHRISHIFGYTGTVLALCMGMYLLYGQTLGRSVIRVERVELEFESLPASYDGLRVVHFSDTHLGTLVNRDRFIGRLVDTVNMLNPDIVIQSGDIINTHVRELDHDILQILGGIKSRYGIYSVLGNHDLGIYIHDTTRHSPTASVAELINRQKAMGWAVLCDSSLYIYNGHDSISVTGLNYPADANLNSHSQIMAPIDVDEAYKDVPDSMFNLTISHAPQLWDDVLKIGKADLTVAGHVHAMQIKLWAGSRVWSPAMLLYDRWSGLYEKDGRYLYINDGIGYVMFPMRIGTKPEVTLYVLRSAKK